MQNRSEYHNSSSSLENLHLISYCPLCNTHYNPSKASILEEADGAHLIHISCKKCSSSILAVIITGGIGISSIGLITDLTDNDVMKFKLGSRVDEDDVIDAVKSISKGDLIKLLNE